MPYFKYKICKFMRIIINSYASRPYCFGLGAFGQAGVERVLDLVNRELMIAMRGSGTTSVNAITSDYVHDNDYRV